MKFSTLYFSAGLLLAITTGCAAPETYSTARDAQGNYATSSSFKAPQRTEFVAAMSAGLTDFDMRRADLESRASRLGQSAINELHAHLPGLIEKRTTFVNESARLEAALDKDWPTRRQETQVAYDSLRVALDAAYEDVLK